MILAAIECEDTCADVHLKCMINCNGDSQCVSACTRTLTNCLDNCPCHINCYEGCPCPNDNDFCVTHCHENFKDEYDICRNDLREQLFKCEDDCHFNPECEHQCFVNYENEMKNCPCMENCSKGCPCPGFDCGYVTPTTPTTTTTSTTITTTTTTKTTTTTTTTTTTRPPKFTNGILVTQGKYMNGDCYENDWGYLSKATSQRKYNYEKIGYLPAYTSNKASSIETCKHACDTTVDDGPNQYDYAILMQNDCWCGIMEPFKEKIGQCRFSCGGNHNELCGGPNGEASFYSIRHKGSFVLFLTKTFTFKSNFVTMGRNLLSTEHSK